MDVEFADDVGPAETFEEVELAVVVVAGVDIDVELADDVGAAETFAVEAVELDEVTAWAEIDVELADGEVDAVPLNAEVVPFVLAENTA